MKLFRILTVLVSVFALPIPPLPSPVVYAAPSAVFSSGFDNGMNWFSLGATYRFGGYISQVSPGSGCTAGGNMEVYVNWTDAISNAGASMTLGQFPIDSAGPQVFQFYAIYLRAARNTAITYHVDYNDQCTVYPSYQFFPLLEQLTNN